MQSSQLNNSRTLTTPVGISGSFESLGIKLNKNKVHDYKVPRLITCTECPRAHSKRKTASAAYSI